MQRNNNLQTKIVETYAEDMAQVIESDKGGLIKKIIQEEEAHEAEKKNLSPESKKNKFFITAGTALVFFALLMLFFFFNQDSLPLGQVQEFTPIIFTDRSEYLEVAGFKREEIIQTVLNKIRATELKEGGVEAIYLTENKKVAGWKKFISLIQGNFAEGGKGIIEDAFLFGAVKSGDESKFFILLQTKSLSDVFPSLRKWEGKMFSDLHGFFGAEITSSSKYLLTKEWQDGIVANKNARILYDNDNNIIMMYIFADDTSVIITDTNEIAIEIMLRLAGSQIKK